ncbi:hypothetical protein D3C78_792870 [compost metagenome]
MNSVNWNGYEVYPDGRIFGKRGWFLAPQLDHRGYPVVKVRVNNGNKTVKVHYLVATCFVDNPENLVEVNHKDGNKLNSWHENLEWSTRSQNIKHAYDTKLRCAKGTNNARCKVTEEIVREVCELLDSGKSAASIRDMGYSYSLVRAIKSGKNWSHISQEYSFRHQGSETIETAA